ncbi:MAG: CAP domain-containing protein [Myxococcota bacterium]|nr:CAP domain-containing protein [Myxococcota bacterium]
MERSLFDALNDERRSRGLPSVAIDERLLCAARRHARDVGASGSCGHVGSDGSWPWDRAMACGFPQHRWTVNEIAAGPGFRDGPDAVWGWRHSSGHYAAIVHPRARFVGVAEHRSCFIALFDCCVAGSE